MTQVTVKELAKVVDTPVERLLQQMREAGLSHESAEQVVTDSEKQALLAHLKSSHGDKVEEPRKITLQRKTTSTLRVAGSKTISVEVRKKKTFVKRSPEELEAEKQRELEAQQAAAEAERLKAEEEAKRKAEEEAKRQAATATSPASAPAAAPAPVSEPVVAAPVAEPTPAPAPQEVVETKRFTLTSDVLFDFGKATLKPEGQTALTKLYNEINNLAMKDHQTVVYGYTDQIGSTASNQSLSQKRAQTVATYLSSKGIPANNISAVGRGEANPVTGTSCSTVKNRKALIVCLAPDRRVEIEVKGVKEVVVKK